MLQDLSDHKFIDIRTKGEFEGNTVKGAKNIPLNEIYKHLEEMDK